MRKKMIGSDVEPASTGEPLFNIGVVSHMTNIMKTTLRVWERRYHFPRSARTAGGHRLYSQQEIMRLKWVKLRIDEGMQVSKAIQALYHLEREQGIGEATPAPQSSTIGNPASTSLPALKQRLLEALL